MVKILQRAEKIIKFYDQQVQEYGTEHPYALHWSSTASQELRFAILSRIDNLAGLKVLDLGCGVGDLYSFFQNNGINVNYEGWDISQHMIKGAKQKYPQGVFRNKDFFQEYQDANFDYILASGTMSFLIDDHEVWLKEMISKMFSQAQKGIAFNLLNAVYHDKDEKFFYADLKKIIDYCKELTPFVFVKDDYLEWDFTVFMYKNVEEN